MYNIFVKKEIVNLRFLMSGEKAEKAALNWLGKYYIRLKQNLRISVYSMNLPFP